MNNSLNSFLTFALICHLITHNSSFASSIINGFTVDLIHRDSKVSPFYNDSATSGELLRNSALRSLTRTKNHFHLSSSDGEKLESGLLPIYGDYLMKISLGSPPIESLAIMDTGSDLSWIQCAPCLHCYRQDHPMFNPTKSSTYLELACKTGGACESSGYSCRKGSNKCEYKVPYLDGSFTSGVLATETITFDGEPGQPRASIANFTFGCGHQNEGVFSAKGSGLVGLGRGSLSLTSQLQRRDGTLQTFSYCLVPPTSNANSKLRFGKYAALSGGNTIVSTPILTETNFYYLNLEGASIGGMKISNSETDHTNGNIIIDSGTMLTKLEPGFYNDIEVAIKKVAGIKPVLDPRKEFRLCYRSFPKIQNLVFHFTGADVTLKRSNIFQQVEHKLVCLMIIPDYNSTRIFGNVAQINFQVKYDLPKRLVSFAPADCSKF